MFLTKQYAYLQLIFIYVLQLNKLAGLIKRLAFMLFAGEVDQYEDLLEEMQGLFGGRGQLTIMQVAAMCGWGCCNSRNLHFCLFHSTDKLLESVGSTVTLSQVKTLRS